jgi:hypothetical protein
MNFLNNFLFWEAICTLRKKLQAEIRCLAICDTSNKTCHTLQTQTATPHSKFLSSCNCYFCHCQSNPQHVQAGLNIYSQISGIKISVDFYIQMMHNVHLYNKCFLTAPSTVLNVQKWEALIVIYWHVHAVHCSISCLCTALNYSNTPMRNICSYFIHCNYSIIRNQTRRTVTCCMTLVLCSAGQHFLTEISLWSESCSLFAHSEQYFWIMHTSTVW